MKQGYLCLVLLTVTTVLTGGCGKGGFQSFPYEPVVTLSGRFDGSEREFPGHLTFPNECTLDHDTIKMFFCTSDYSPGPDPVGAYVRIHIYTPVIPSMASDTTLIGNRHLFVKMGDYDVQGNCSYEVVPADTLRSDWHAQFNINRFEARHGGRVDLERGELRAKALDDFCGLPLDVTDAAISGRIQ